MTKNCLYCKKEFIVPKNKRNEKSLERIKCCSKKCLYEYNRIVNKKSFIYENVNCSICNKNYERQVNAYRKKMYCSNECSRIARKNNPYIPTQEHRKKISDSRKRDWMNGDVYKNAQAGRTKWLSYTTKNNIVFRVQGTWELKFLEWLETNSYTYEVHRGHLTYKDENNEERVYLPDFYVKEWKSYVDIKNSYLFSLTKTKFDCIIRDNPNVNIKVLLKEDLINLGIIL
jgi:hypothetical protein